MYLESGRLWDPSVGVGRVSVSFGSTDEQGPPKAVLLGILRDLWIIVSTHTRFVQ